jgi:hypothetical protein
MSQCCGPDCLELFRVVRNRRLVLESGIEGRLLSQFTVTCGERVEAERAAPTRPVEPFRPQNGLKLGTI